ncbi:MAG: YibE/F family protein [Kiritimatiellae bacterium]|nr:YibE/F family protein [Kiritimatiellia bacterium]
MWLAGLGLTAFLGGELGLLTACGLALIMSRYFHLSGINRPFAKSLIFIQPDLDVFGLFISGIFISASGAVMDLAMDIAASMHEIPLLLMLNSTNVASDILITLVGSFGLVTVAPFSAFIGAFLYSRGRDGEGTEDVEGR